MSEMVYYLKRLNTFAGKILYFNLLGTVIVSILDGLGMLLLIPMLSMTGIFRSNGSYVTRELLFFLIEIPKHLILPLILIIYITLVIGQSLLQKYITIQDVKIQQGFMNNLKEDCYRGLLSVRWEFYLRSKKTNLINSLTKDISRIGMGIRMFLLLTSSLIFTLIQISLAFWLSPQVSSLILICGAGLAFFSWRFVKQAKALGKETTQLSRKYLSGISEHLSGIKDIKTNALEGSRMYWIQSLNKKMLAEQVNYAKVQTNSQLAYKTSLGLIITGFIYLSVLFFPSEPEKLLVVIILFSRLWPRFIAIQTQLQQIAMSIPAFKVLKDLEDKINASKELQLEDEKMEEALPIHTMIGCQNISYKYPSNNTFALLDINLHIPVNSMTAIVGPSGAGKSTLLDLLMGVLRPTSGELIVNGNPLSEEEIVSFRKNISFIPQDPFLFNMSIKKNLLLMKPNATEHEIWEALEFAAAADFVKSLPKGLNTRIGDRGINLSGGERQRIVLARTILRKPPVLILDEATSALDEGNETKIQQALLKLKGKMTIIIIAHRPKTIENAHIIIELNNGKIVRDIHLHEKKMALASETI